jgi:leucyl/phenylalanyl-tRNA---protein transferase
MVRDPYEVDDLLVPIGVEDRPLPPDIRLSHPKHFPPPTASTVEGLLCVGGRLSSEWLLDAYSHGIFPWPMWDDQPIAWWSPDPRAVIELDGLRISRRLRRTLQSRKFHVTCDRDFAGVIRACATVDDRENNTWLTPLMIAAYCRMHALGYAHSIEVWVTDPNDADARHSAAKPTDLAQVSVTKSKEGARLVGGTYGIAIGGLFAAESMFHAERDASKVALAHLVSHLRVRGYELLDIQQLTPHTESLGATEISKSEYLRRLVKAIELPITFGDRLTE